MDAANGMGENGDRRRLVVQVPEQPRDGQYEVDITVYDAGGSKIDGASGKLGPLPEGRPLDGMSAADSERAGRDLLEALAPRNGAVRGIWDNALADRVAGLVFDIRTTELRALPWELIGDDIAGWPFRAEHVPAVRGQWPFARAGLDALRVPLHLLVVVGALTEELDVAAEIQAIYRGLRGAPCCWHVDVLAAPTQRELHDEYERIQPDVLHFIGHGSEVEGRRGLDVRPVNRDQWTLDAGYVIGNLQPLGLPRLVVLNSCKTPDEPGQATGTTRGVAEAFLQSGAAAVISMQGDVGSQPASVFAEELYLRLAGASREVSRVHDRPRRRAEPVDKAVAGARKAVGLSVGGEIHPADWALPTLEVAADPAEVLGRNDHPDPLALILRRNGFDRVPRVVDRSVIRRQMHQAMCATSGQLLFVTGADQRSGKSEVVRSCVITHAVRGQRVIYVSFEGNQQIDDKKFMTEIAGAAVLWLGDDAKAPCEKFLAARKTSERVAGMARFPKMPKRPQQENPADRLYVRLQNLLMELAGPEPLVLVIDNVSMVDDLDTLSRKRSGGRQGGTSSARTAG